MTRTSKLTTFGLLATLAATMLTPVLADPAGQQKNKNNWRNLGIAGAVIAGYGLLKGNQTATVLGAAGGAYAANRYETDRQHQSQDSQYNQYNNYDNSNNGSRRYHRTGGWQPPVVNNNGYDNQNQDYQDSQSQQWADGRHDNGRHGNGHQDNGRHRGWTKHQGEDGERD